MAEPQPPEPISLILIDDEKVFLSIAPKDSQNNPVDLDEPALWASSDTSIATVEPSADGLSCVVKTVGPIGTAQITVKGDADLGDGTEELTGVINIEVKAGKAVTLGVAAGTPEPR